MLRLESRITAMKPAEPKSYELIKSGGVGDPEPAAADAGELGPPSV